MLVLIAAWAFPCPGQEYRVDTLARGSDAEFPTALAFTPDGSGRFFFTEKNSGRVQVYDRGLLPTPFATVSVENDGEQGLLGIAVYPGYPDTPWVYLYYTRRVDRSNIVERFRDSAGIGTDPRLVLIVPRLDDGATHNGGSMRFGPDRRLYLCIGDYGLGASAAENISSARNVCGKILRVNADGSIPQDNPFPHKPFWAFGIASGGGFTFEPGTGSLICTESGGSGGDEILRAAAGSDLGATGDGGRAHGPGPHKPLLKMEAAASPALAAIVLYRANAFPALTGKILFGGTSSATIWAATSIDGGDSLVAFPLFKSLGGFSDIEVGPDGDLYLVNGPYYASRILRLAPLPPAFISSPPSDAVQDSDYQYRPVFSGTPPSLEIASGPAGMTIDSTGELRWKPTNDDALTGACMVTLLAENGAGSAEQSFTIDVQNVNDPPSNFRLISPADNASFGFFGGDPAVTFSWEQAIDPDRDTVRYTLELDTVSTFESPARRDTVVTETDSIRLAMPRVNGTYYWRVTASDGKLNVRGSPQFCRLLVTFLAQSPPDLKQKVTAPALEQNYPNPFNPATSIKYTIPHGGHVRLSVYNLLGQEVARLVDGIQSEGTYEFEFNRMNLPSGIYFYRIQAPGLVETKKMVIAK